MTENKPTIYITTDIFTPTQPAKINYVERTGLESKLSDALSTPGKQIVIYGHSGSGKSSLLRKNIEKYYEGEIILSCTNNTTMEQIIINAFDDLDGYYTSEKSSKNDAKLSFELKSIYSSIKSELSSEKSIKQSRIVPVQLTAQRLAQFIGEAKRCLVLEDFHKVSIKEKRKLSQTMKVFMDTSYDYPTTKIIAIGAVDSARDIVNLDSEMKNRVAEIKVPLMSKRDLQKIIDNGCSFLNIDIVHNVKMDIINYSSGLASYCHQICLNMCRNKSISETCKIEKQLLTPDFRDAIKMVNEHMEDSLKAKLDKAFKNTSSRKFDNIDIILKSILNLKNEEVSRAQISEKISETIKDYPPGNLSKYLTELATDKRSKILKFDANSNKYSFVDPMLRANILFRFNGKEENTEMFNKYGKIKITPDDIKAAQSAIDDISSDMDEDEDFE